MQSALSPLRLRVVDKAIKIIISPEKKIEAHIEFQTSPGGQPKVIPAY